MRPKGHRWNPSQQEVIVIEDSASPGRAGYHEPPANNTRSATNKRRRLPETSRTGQTSNYHVPSSYDMLPTPHSMQQSLPYEYASYGLQLAYPTADPVPVTSSSVNLHPFSHQYGASEYDGPYGSPYNVRRQNSIASTSKRKRTEYEEPTYFSGQSRNATYTMQSSTSSRHSRAHKKNKEVVLRKEPDVLPNFSGKPYDDKEGHYVIVANSELTNRYLIDRLLGQGTFGKVVRAYDRHKRSWVAIKIIRAVQKYRDASMIELRVLRTLHENDPRNVK